VLLQDHASLQKHSSLPLLFTHPNFRLPPVAVLSPRQHEETHIPEAPRRQPRQCGPLHRTAHRGRQSPLRPKRAHARLHRLVLRRPPHRGRPRAPDAPRRGDPRLRTCQFRGALCHRANRARQALHLPRRAPRGRHVHGHSEHVAQRQQHPALRRARPCPRSRSRNPSRADSRLRPRQRVQSNDARRQRLRPVPSISDARRASVPPRSRGFQPPQAAPRRIAKRTHFGFHYACGTGK
jgi:hypothetical protein